MARERHHGSCQCGAVGFSVDLDLDAGAVSCNCSRCRRLGSILGFAPRGAFAMERGADNLTAFRFNRHAIEHLFCKTCGIQCFAYGSMPDGTATVAVNLRTLDGFDPGRVTITMHDGAAD